LNANLVQKPIKARTIKAKPVSEKHTRTAVNEIREIFKALLSIDLSREITLNLWRGKVGQATRLLS
jgi:hypothetical protein